MKKVTILVPAYNEQEVLPLLYDRLIKMISPLTAYQWEILFVNDGSRDNTLQIIKELRAQDERVSYIDLSRNFGKETAMLAGFDYFDGDALVIIDADLQDPPELIPQMLEKWEEGYDDVYARRRTREGESFLKKATSKLFYRVLQRSTKIPIQKDTGDFRLLDKRCVGALCKMRESQRYTKGFFSWIGYNKAEILFDRAPRAAGKTKWNYLKLFQLAFDGITSFTTAPLRFATVSGLLVSLLALLYMLFIFIRTLIFGNPVAGYPSLLVIMLFLGGIQLISIGVIGEYIGRIFNETKHRPPYFVKEYNDEREQNEK